MTYRRWVYSLIGLCLLLLVYNTTVTITHAQSTGPIYIVKVQGTITNVTINYLERALRQAEASSATALIIQLSNQGAVLRAIRPFAARIATAEIPVVVYVAPEQTNAGAAGAFFLSAAHVAAMAPATSFGTPTPLVEIDGLLTEQTQELLLDSVEQQLHTWNADRGRNTDWVNRAVRSGVWLTNEQAIAANPPAVDIIARDTDELLTLLEGRTIRLENQAEVQLRTLGREPVLIRPTLWEQLRLLLADPTIAFLLLVMGAVAIYAELANPGTAIFAGIGIVLVLSALVGMLSLPVRWISVAGLFLAFILVALDLYVPSQGALTAVGIVVLITSALTLVDTFQAPNVFVALWAIMLVVVIATVVVVASIWLILRTRTQPIATGQESMLGRLAEVRQRLDPEGMVFIEGALWRAISEDGEVEPGEWVRVIAIYDLRLVVRRLDADDDRARKQTMATVKD